MRPLLPLLCCCCLLTGLRAAQSWTLGEYQDPASHELIMKYALMTPPGKPVTGIRWGLILALHGIGGNEQQLMATLQQSLDKADRREAYVVLGLKSKGKGWETVDHGPIRQTVAWALTQWPIDPRRVYALGYSHGAIRLGQFGAEAQDLFAGVSIMAGTCRKLPTDPDPAETAVQYYLLTGEKDPIVKPEQIRQASVQMREKGIRRVYREIIGADHGVGWHPEVKEHLWADTIRWFDAIRNRQMALDADQTAALATLEDELVKGKSLTGTGQKTVNLLVELDGPEVNAVVVKLLTAESASTRKAGAVLCTQRLYGDQVLAALVPLLDDRDRQVKGAALVALVRAAGWQCPAAQDGLYAWLKDEENPATDRKVVLQALSPLLTVEAFCSVKDQGLQDLMAHLASEAEPDRNVRQAAAALLADPPGKPQETRRR